MVKESLSYKVPGNSLSVICLLRDGFLVDILIVTTVYTELHETGLIPLSGLCSQNLGDLWSQDVRDNRNILL